MAFIIWTPEYSVKNSVLDEQHKKILAMMNDAYMAVTEKSPRMNVSRLITSMSEYAISHFSKEEGFMRSCKYEKMPSHKEKHDEFFKKVSYFTRRLSESDPLIYREITDFLQLWLFDHILKEDMQYVECFQKNNLT
jgi:hemerythrin